MPLGDVVFGLNEQGTLVSTPASAGQALLGGCIGAFPNRDGIDSGGSWWLVGSSAGNVEEDEESGVSLVLFRSENPDSGGPGLWRGGNSLVVGWTPHKPFITAVQMTFTDPSANAVAGLGGGFYGLGGNFLRLGSGRVGELLERGSAARRAALRSRSSRGRCSVCASTSSFSRCRRATLSSSSSTARAGSAIRSVATRARRRSTSRRAG